MTDQQEHDIRRAKFDERREKCIQPIRDVLDFLMTVAANAGHDVDPPTFDGREGVGVTYRKRGTRFCRFDPKFDAGSEHVFSQIPDVSRDELRLAGTLPDPPRQDDGWVKVENMRHAVQLVPIILRKYENP